MSEQENADRIELSFGETVKFESGSFKKFEVGVLTHQKPDEGMKDCYIRAKKLIDAMARIGSAQVREGI